MKKIVALVIAILMSLWMAPAYAGQDDAPSIRKIAKEVGCKNYEVRSASTAEINLKATQCVDKKNREIVIVTFPTRGQQAKMITLQEQEVIWKNWKPEFWFARCDRYSVNHYRGLLGGGKAWAKAYVKKHKGCTLQLIDGKTFS